jgi:hypothetical protein
MIAWWWLLVGFAAGWVGRSVRTQAQLLRLGYQHARETQAWAREVTRAWALCDQLEADLAELQRLYDEAFDAEARRLGLQ